MAGGFPEVPALRAACFARCCTAPLRSLIYHCVHLLSLLSLSLCLPRRSHPCCRDLQFYAGPKPALVVCLASLRDSCYALLDVNGLGHGYGAWHDYICASSCRYNICSYMAPHSRAGKWLVSVDFLLWFSSPVKVAVLLHQLLH